MNSSQKSSYQEESFDFEDLFKKCTQSEVDLYEKQQFYEEYMDVASCVFKYSLFHFFQCNIDKQRSRERSRERDDKDNKEIEKIDNFIVMLKYFGTNLKYLYGNSLLLFDETKGKYKGKITDDINISNDENARKIIQGIRLFFDTRDNIDLFMTVISLKGYPKLREIFYDYFRKNDIETKDIIPDSGSFVGDILLTPVDGSKFNENMNIVIQGFKEGYKVGKYQVLTINNSVLNIKHPNDVGLYKYYRNNPYHNFIDKIKDTALYHLSIKWCDIVEKYNNYKYGLLDSDDSDNIKKLCFEIYYLFVNMVPYSRGSASAGKVLLNACLSAFGFDIVRETPEYHKHSDWVAFVSDDFENFYSKVDKMFIDKE